MIQTMLRVGLRRFVLLLFRGMALEDVQCSTSTPQHSFFTRSCECKLVTESAHDWPKCDETVIVNPEDLADADSPWNSLIARKCPNFRRVLTAQNDYFYASKLWLSRHPDYVVFEGHPPN